MDAGTANQPRRDAQISRRCRYEHVVLAGGNARSHLLIHIGAQSLHTVGGLPTAIESSEVRNVNFGIPGTGSIYVPRHIGSQKAAAHSDELRAYETRGWQGGAIEPRYAFLSLPFLVGRAFGSFPDSSPDGLLMMSCRFQGWLTFWVSSACCDGAAELSRVVPVQPYALTGHAGSLTLSLRVIHGDIRLVTKCVE
jgi:hypothetical protein